MRQVVRWIGILALFGILSKVLGFMREASLASCFGASGITDAYLIAMTVPYLLFGLVNVSIETAVIPVFAESAHNDSPQEYRRLVWSGFHLVLLASLPLVLFGVIFAPLWVPRVAPGFDPQRLQLAISLSRLLLPMLVFQGLFAWSKGLLQSRQKFFTLALSGIPFNLISIVFILWAARHGTTWLAVGTVLAVAGQFFIQLPAIARQHIPYAPAMDFRHPGLKRIGRLLPPVLLGVGAEQINFMVNRVIASGLPSGRISALNYAERSLGLTQGVLGFPLVNVLYSELAKHAAADRMDEYWTFLRRGITLIGFAMLPMTVGVLVLAHDVTRVLYQRGAFTSADTRLTAYAVLFYSLGMPFLVWRDYLSRAFYALQDAVSPLKNSLWMVGLNIALNLLLVRPMSHGGLALGSSLAAAFGTIGLAVRLYRRNGGTQYRDAITGLLRILAASLAMGALLWAVAVRFPVERTGTGFLAQAVRIGAMALLCLPVYGVFAWLLRVPEMGSVITYVRQKFARVPASEPVAVTADPR